MIRHTALFRFRDGTAGAQIDALMAGLLALKNDIAVIDRTAWGEIFSDRANGHTHVVSFDFRDRAALEIFYGHPAHKQIAETQIKPITTSLLVIDYEKQNA